MAAAARAPEEARLADPACARPLAGVSCGSRPLAGDFLRALASNGTTAALVVGSHRAADFVVLRRPEGGTPASAPARMESAEAALGASFAPAREDSVAPVRVAGDEV